MHQPMAAAVDRSVADIRRVQERARSGVDTNRPRWPVIVLGSPEGWTGPQVVDAAGRLVPELAALAPTGPRRTGANPHTNDGLLLRDLHLPDFRDHAVVVPAPGAVRAQDTAVLGEYLRDVVTLNDEQCDLRIFGPDETLSNRLGACLR